MAAFYTEKLQGYPDVLSVKQVVKFTGYQSSSVIYWCKLNYLKAYSIPHDLAGQPFSYH